MTAQDDRLIRFGIFEMDAAAGELRKAGRKVRLAPQPWRVLHYLAARPGRLVTRQELIDHVWGGEVTVDFDAGLATALRHIRAALGDTPSSPRFVETVPRRGYRFVAPVIVVRAGAGPAPAEAPPASGRRCARPGPRAARRRSPPRRWI